MIKIIPVSAFKDNYIWLIGNPEASHCLVVDPGEAEPVYPVLRQYGWAPMGILVTHHHYDHTGGVGQFVKENPTLRVFASAEEMILEKNNPLWGNEIINIPEMGISFKVIAIPGHTRAHLVYYGDKALFCGDTLFTGGCGRVFEGTMEQMYSSLQKLADFPDETRVYCGHEYTEANLRFACKVEPENEVLRFRIIETQRLRAQGLPTVPSTLGLEKNTNPFLRCGVQAVREAAERYVGKALERAESVFSVLRKWKDGLT